MGGINSLIERAKGVDRDAIVSGGLTSAWRGAQKAFGADELDYTDEQRLNLELQPKLEAVFAQVRGVLNKADKADIEAMTLDGKIKLLEGLRNELVAGIETQANAAGTTYDAVVAQFGGGEAARRVK